MNQVKPIPVAEFDPETHVLPIADTHIRTGDRVMLYTLNELHRNQGVKTHPTRATPAPAADWPDWTGIAEHDAEEGEPVRIIIHLSDNPHILIVTEV